MEVTTVYHASPGKENTDETIRAAGKRAAELGIKTLVVASNRGKTALRAVELLPGLRIVAVSHVTGFREPNDQEFTEENRKLLTEKGVPVVTASHAFAGVNRAMRNKYQAPSIGTVIADTLRTFGHGTKVACEITLMAADAGLVRTGEDVISIGGTNGGADTALVLNAANSDHYFDLKVKEIICKPRLD